MAGPGILRAVLVAVVALYLFSYEGFCAKAERKAPATGPSTLRVDLMRRDSPHNPFLEARNLSNAERLRRAIQRSHNKLRRFQNAGVPHSTTSYYSPVNYKNYEFFMQLGIGSPVPLNLHFILDTGSDLIWTQCKPCESKYACIPQEDPFYNPSHSSSFRNDSCSSSFCKAVEGQCDGLKNCNYFYLYGDFSSTSGNMAYETFSLRQVGSARWASLPNISFGCGRNQGGSFSNSSGIVGLGRGPLSLVSQLRSSTNNVFSYCLASIYNASAISPLFFGDLGLASFRHRTTPLIQNKYNPSFYYLGLRRISVDRENIHVPKATFQLAPNGDGGVVIDSGTTLTYFTDPAYKPFLHAVRASIRARAVNASSVGLDLCYRAKSVPRFPTIAFHFKGGARYVLPEKNSFISLKTSTGDDLVCLAFASAGPAGSPSIIGNVQQQNFHIAYDLGRNKLSFAHKNCASL